MRLIRRPLPAGLVLTALAVCSAAGPTRAQPNAAAASGAPAVQEQLFGAWSLTCPQQPSGACVLSQAVARDPQGRQVVLGAIVLMTAPAPKAKPQPRLEFRMSAQAVPQAGLGLKIGDGPEYKLKMSACTAKACSAMGWLDAPLRKALQAAPAAQVAFLMPPRQQVLVPLNLTGLEEGLKALERSVR